MSPVGESNVFSEKNTGFLINSGHKAAAAIVSDFVRGGFRYGGGLHRYDGNGGGGGDRRRRTS